MAAITPRKNKSGEIISYTIRVYHGYDSSGNRLKPYTMTYKPEPGMTAKQVEKELNRQAVQFEEKCMRGGVADPTIRLSDFCEKYLEIAKGTLGHGDIETTNKYLHVLEEADVEAAKALDIMLLQKPAEKEKNIS